MRTIVATLMATTMAAAAFSAAKAADAVNEVPQAPVAVEQPAPIKDWSGAYLGGTVNYDWGRFSGSNNGRDADGFGGGLYGGYNWQSGQIVYGAEADIAYGDEKGSAGTFAGESLQGKQKLNGSLRARVGYDMNPFLIYGTGGLAVGNHEISNPGSKDDATALGYTVGAGVEALVTDNITARLEYRYTDYQNKDFTLDTGTVSRGFDDHSVKAGIGVKF
ncbi:outer membrane protein [Agrobacterium larrymoorei]|uniref:Porin family protein n=1 Tax=Agrobacterium larrymoorei TaxID=160699 RepID=A0A4D7DXU9_9HYPH|nr:outer membrane protein [Agrobacterium larrymoorei]QCJ00308.1 porin family protein [Agrobacterium larrymoorei]QYA09247.1 porin family protein [Agrobacterium larrymoorei]